MSMSSVGVEVRGSVDKMDGQALVNVLNSLVEKLDGAEADLGPGLSYFRAQQSRERTSSSNVNRKEDTGHECSFCCTCWTDE
ncbi:hypothetical protein [Paenibacillus sp. AN1007]|uniref:Uncharacterized protein n=1 Tax=Paenibacillus sp. AN1007 TaxID=3151385 RepID=A0AAU8N962_9BACL